MALARPGLRDRTSSTARRACAGLRLAGRPLRRPRASTRRCGPRSASAPTSSPSSTRRRTPPSARPSRPCPKRVRGLVNAVLRRVADAPRDYPDDATRLSYPDWIVERLLADLGPDDGARRARGDERAGRGDRAGATATCRTAASQLVTEAVGAVAGDRRGRPVRGARAARPPAWPAPEPASWPSISRPARAGLVAANASRLGVRCGCGWSPTAGARPYGPPRPTACWSTHRARVSAPCAAAPTPAGGSTRLRSTGWPHLQRELLDGAADLVAPGGTLSTRSAR